MVVVRDLLRNQDHAVLSVAAGGHDLILDNQAPTVDLLKDVTHYRAYYAINDTGWWAYFDPTVHAAGPPVATVR